jgi:hypothetical protein
VLQLGIRRQQVGLLGQPPGQHQIIGIKKGNEGVSGLSPTQIAGRRNALARAPDHG